MGPKGLVLDGKILDLAFKHSNFAHSIVVKALEDLVFIAKGWDVSLGLGSFAGFRGFQVFINCMFVIFSLDFLEKMFLASLEKLMIIDMVYILSSSFMEIVHVELTNKGCQVVVLEVCGGGHFGRIQKAFW